MIALVAALCGGALVLSLAPFDFWPLAFVSAGGLYTLLVQKPHAVNRIAFAFGLAKYGLGVSWVYVSIHVYGSASPLLAGLLVVLMVSFMALFCIVQLRLFLYLRTHRHVIDWLLFAALWVTFEWFWTWFLSGFPWLFAGYSQLTSPLAGLAPVGGVFLVSLAVVFVGVAAASALQRPIQEMMQKLKKKPTQELMQEPMQNPAQKSMHAAFSILLVASSGVLLDRFDWTVPGATFEAALVQGNTPQSVKWDADQRDSIVRTHLQLSAPWWGRVDVIVWSEGAITYWAHEADALLGQLRQQGLRSHTALVTGIPLAERVGDEVLTYNGVIAVGAASGQYRKQDLVPFGEYVPFENLLRGLIAFFDLPMSSFSPGPVGQPLLQVKGLRMATMICYEIAYPETSRALSVDADVLTTISNDTWFGASIGPLQHMQIARMRARETGRWVLRATNNGVTGIIDPRGRITASIPQFMPGVLTARLSPCKAPRRSNGSAIGLFWASVWLS